MCAAVISCRFPTHSTRYLSSIVIVRESDPKQVLRSSRDKLLEELSPGKLQDPFTVLPVELIIWIFEYVSFKGLWYRL